jgi:hypothetical protein
MKPLGLISLLTWMIGICLPITTMDFVNGLEYGTLFWWEKCAPCTLLTKGDLEMDPYHSCMKL